MQRDCYQASGQQSNMQVVHACFVKAQQGCITVLAVLQAAAWDEAILSGCVSETGDWGWGSTAAGRRWWWDSDGRKQHWGSTQCHMPLIWEACKWSCQSLKCSPAVLPKQVMCSLRLLSSAASALLHKAISCSWKILQHMPNICVYLCRFLSLRILLRTRKAMCMSEKTLKVTSEQQEVL